MFEVLLFTLHGLLGAALAVLVKAYSWRYLKTWPAIKYYLLGLASGYIYWWLHSEYSFPNAFASIAAGYFSSDFILSVMDRLKPWVVRR